jgi:hypothetical protein
MTRLFSLRLVGAVALCSSAFVLASTVPYLHAAPVTAGLSEPDPSVSVNHFQKGDRLPLFRSHAVQQGQPASGASQTKGKVPFGCDSSFSPVTSPELATVYGRCMS